MKKRILGTVLAAGLLAATALAGCGSNDNDDLLAQIQANGKIVIAMEGNWAPWTYHDESGELVGFDTEIGKLIAEKLGVEAEFAEGDWDGLLTGLETGRYDVMINGVEVTEERAEKYDFTDPYCYIHTALIVKSDNTDIKTFEDLNGKTTANSLDSTYQYLAQEYGATVLNVEALNDTLDMVLSGRADATLNAEVSYYDYMGEHPEAQLKVVDLTDEASLVVIPLRKGEETDSLRKAINQALQELRESGELAALSLKYFGMDITGAE